jgi:hypothetical protein
MLTDSQLVVGQRYRITFKRDSDRTVKTMVLDFMSVFDREYLFSGRPIVGTQTIPRRWVRKIEEVPQTEPIQLTR